jgi:hypothetical protein
MRIEGGDYMKNSILYDIKLMTNGEKIKIFSCGRGIENSDAIETYELFKSNNDLYIQYSKFFLLQIDENNSYSEPRILGRKIEFSSRVLQIGTFDISFYDEQFIHLTESERKEVISTMWEDMVIKQGCNLKGVFDNGFTFDYPNIIAIQNVE